MVLKILQEVKEKLPDRAKINQMAFEGANIVLYTKSKDFFLDNNGTIKDIVNEIKKRIEVRPDPSLCLEQEDAEVLINKLVPKEAKIDKIIFDPQRSMVVIEAEKPGLVIGKAGEILKEIKKQTMWVPLVKRTPAIRSKLIENIRSVLYLNDDYRKKFLNKVGERIYGGRIRGKKEEWIRVTFLGGARQVGRSSLLLQTPESRILLDCGINVAASGDSMYPFLDSPEFKINELDAVIVTHAHLDHCGLIPLLYKYGYTGPIYCTKPTRDVMALLCLDYISVAAKDAKKQIYSSTDIKNMVKHSICLDYEEVSDITPDIRLTFYNAGHTLGSSMAHMHIGEGLHNLLYTGDMNYEMSNLLAPASTKFPRLETVIVEATYGNKESVMSSREEAETYLLDIINKTIDRKGRVLMPVLGVGRSQEIMLVLERAMREGKIPNVPIFVQGMVWDVTAIHTAYPDFFNSKVKKQIFHKDQNPFLSKIFKQVGSQKEMKQILEETGPCIILATSGMMTGGASVEYFKELAGNDKNSLVLTCYQGEGSLGKRLQQGEKQIAFQSGHNQNITEVKMDIYSIHSFTGHSDYQQLLNFAQRLNPKPKKIILNHGESSNCLEMASTLHKLLHIETNAPKNLESIRIR
ncbi:MAG: beta-CASP ribonuclease aCPSF1 [Nanoarchaeota archaeon]|nr:beta-CASP ribonuclease aCPSF1 [Nanoarchaeota archaeon]MBU1445298.1 beta-CASP ribonuclease aCPSF1 [Nanoarchaeota archaeon]MBU2406803.1 beta-CASP ribonuclease aCPSF1 [Nanoarchaeota archaeon]MBU2420494.1 beta-CASP ribonuclease aCPSF1 [Nanoarchaeota archaeon]MBU2475081.1 beta-CASP ribonuclease aCPSF1 [Nanoarchaeota archaeon]